MAFRRAVSLGKHSYYNTAERYLSHLSNFAKQSEEKLLSSRQKETFQFTLKNIHQLFFDGPVVRAQTYSYETDIYLNSKDPNNAKNTLQLWIRDVETGIALAPTNQQNTHYKLVLEG